MVLSYKKVYFEYWGILLVSVLSGLLISFYNISVLAILAMVFFVIISFRYYDRILLLVILYIPFQIALNISSGFDLASGRVLVLYFLAVWFVMSLADKNIKINLSLQTILVLAFLSLAVFSMKEAWDGERAIRKILVFLSIFPLYFLITSKENKKYVYRILDALFIGGFMISSIGIVQFALQFFLGIDPIMDFWSEIIAPLFYGNTFGAEVISNPSWLVNIGGATLLRAFSLFPDSHMFSFYLGLLIPILASFILFGKGKDSESFIIRNKVLLYLFFLTMIVAELLTFSRGGYLGMILGLGIMLFLSWKHLDFLKKAFLGIVFSAFILGIFFTNQSFIYRLLSSFDFNEGSNSERIKNWNQGAEVFDNNFWLGVGIGNYSREISPSADYRTPIYAHNTYLDIGAEMGIFALVLWLLLFGVTIYQLYDLSDQAEKDSDVSLSLGLIGSLVWFLVHSFFDTGIYSPTVLAILMVILAMAATVITIGKLKSKSPEH